MQFLLGACFNFVAHSPNLAHDRRVRSSSSPPPNSLLVRKNIFYLPTGCGLTLAAAIWGCVGFGFAIVAKYASFARDTPSHSPVGRALLAPLAPIRTTMTTTTAVVVVRPRASGAHNNHRPGMPSSSLVQINSPNRDHPQHSRVGQTKSAYEALNSKKFGWNKTLLAPVGSKALSFLPPTVRNTFKSHAINTWYVGPSMEHYRTMFFNNQRTEYSTSSRTYNPFPAYSNVPTISESDRTVMAALDILEMFKISVPVSAIQKRNHCKILSSLTNILTGHQTPISSRWTPVPTDNIHRQNRWMTKQTKDTPPSRADPASTLRVDTSSTSRTG